MIAIIFFTISAYLIGSISSAIILSKIFGLDDPREVGSGNPGATNVLRSGNKKAAALTLFGDMLKGFIPVALANVLSGSEVILACTAIGAFLGHLYPLYYQFKGGKGVATAMGVFAGINIYIFIVMVATWLITAKLFKMSSLASLACAGIGLFASLFTPALPVIGASFVIVALLFFKHRDNIERIRAGIESKIGDKA